MWQHHLVLIMRKQVKNSGWSCRLLKNQITTEILCKRERENDRLQFTDISQEANSCIPEVSRREGKEGAEKPVFFPLPIVSFL